MVTDPTDLLRLREGVYAQDLLIAAVAELNVLSWLADVGSSSLAAVCRRFGLAERPADVLVTYLTALGLTERDGDQVAVTDHARTHLVGGSDFDLRPYFASLAERPAVGELLEVLRTGRPAAWSSAANEEDWSARLDDAAFAETMTAAMDARGAYLAPALADALDELDASDVLDVAGGSGIYARALLARGAYERVAVLERPPVDEVAQSAIARDGAAERIDVLSRDMFEGLPDGYDLHLFSHVLHDWGADDVRRLLHSSYDALPPGGWFVDHDVHLDADKSGPLHAAAYSVLLMHSTPGKVWSVAELEQMLDETGFEAVTVKEVAADRSAVIAQRST